MTPKNAERFPILLWGDLVRNDAPVLRRSLAGDDAHQCMYAWVYLTDFLALNRLRAALTGAPDGASPSFFKDLDGPLWEKLDRGRIDPISQINAEAFEMVAAATSLAAASNASAPRFVEIGSTFFASKTKFDIVDAVARSAVDQWPAISPKWLGVDNSFFMHDVTALLHGAHAPTVLSDVYDVPRAQDGGMQVLFSRFVASYIFPSGRDFARYAGERFDAVIIEDPYSTTHDTVSVHNHGQHETFFSLPDTIEGLLSEGFDFYILDAYPDFPARTAPCHIVKYVATKKTVDIAEAFSHMRALGFSVEPIRHEDPAQALSSLNAPLTDSMWAQVERAKAASPVWGRTEIRDEDAPPPAPNPHPAKTGWGAYQMENNIVLDVIDAALAREGKL